MAEPRTLLTGLVIGESPRWHDGRLWVANWGTGEVVAVEEDGASDVVLHVPTRIPYSIDWLPDGTLLAVQGREGFLLRQGRDGRLTTYADLNHLSDRGWNELVVDGRGNAYVNGGGFDLMAGEPFSPGMIALVTPDGASRQVADGIAFPNGMAITPDNGTLIIAESYAHWLTAFDIESDGGLANRRTWADLGEDYPDGITVDAEGAVWYAVVPNRHCVRVREGGEVLQTIPVDRGCFACMLGGGDGRTLFIVPAEWGGVEGSTGGRRTGQVLAVPAPAPHAGYP
jgi:sugar lactone lactonase YvrE